MNVQLAFVDGYDVYPKGEPCLWPGAGGKEDEPNDELTPLQLESQNGLPLAAVPPHLSRKLRSSNPEC